MESLDSRFDKLDNASRTGYLVAGFIAHTLTIEEEQELDAWVLESDANMQLFEDLTDEKMVDTFLRWMALRDTEARLKATKDRVQFKKKTRRVTWWQYAAAACLLLLAGFFVYKERLKQEGKVPQATVPLAKADIAPGSLSAVLRLPGGRIVKLEEAIDTTIDNIHIENGQITYAANNGDAMAMHEVVIPRKGFYQLVLPDGTKVWLNNESSIRYPAAFTQATREVTVTGESYFEVAKDASKPFIVKVNDIDVRAIGTAFNIKAYENEPFLKATLVEGIIRVSDKNNVEVLSPDQQISINGKRWIKEDVNVNPAIAWTKNKFELKNTRIEEIMRMVERWYGAKVVYVAKPNFHFNGSIDRGLPVSSLLKLLEQTEHVHFDIDGETIIVKD